MGGLTEVNALDAKSLKAILASLFAVLSRAVDTLQL